MKRIINSLPHGSQKLIAEKLGCSTGYVSSVLNGSRNRENFKGKQIIFHAELIAVKNIKGNTLQLITNRAKIKDNS
jgi:transcriptional regulator with XRE-family HTH domain